MYSITRNRGRIKSRFFKQVVYKGLLKLPLYVRRLPRGCFGFISRISIYMYLDYRASNVRLCDEMERNLNEQVVA
jgi:hypothetical protein